MGLSINKFQYSYTMLAMIKRDVLISEGLMKEDESFFNYDFNKALKTKYPQFILHSDSDGIYISKSSKQYNKLKNRWAKLCSKDELNFFFGDLDNLKKEIELINDNVKFKGYSNKGFVHFYYDVMNARKILEFN